MMWDASNHRHWAEQEAMRHAARADVNRPIIVDALTKSGWLVHDQKVPCDLLCYQRSRRVFLMIEIKDGTKIPSARKHTQVQADAIADGWPIHTVTSLDDLLKLIGRY